MVNGVQCVMMDGALILQKLCADNWVLLQQLGLHSLEVVVVESGLMTYTVMVLNQTLDTAYMEDGDILNVGMKMILV